MIIKTSDINSVESLFAEFTLPQSGSHKGQNGKVLIIGGSSLFHAAVLWSAEVASHFVDMVHFSSTEENQEIFLSLKKIFRNGMIIKQENLFDYVNEDDVILVGTGMIRQNQKSRFGREARRAKIKNQNDIFKIKSEAEYARELTFYLINNFPEKKFVFDAGSLQMMDKEWLLKLKQPAVVTPHQKEFARLFGIDIISKTIKEKEKIVQETAKKFQTVILLKAVDDIISDGKKIIIVKGGNPGLTKGGTGDVLAGLIASFYAKNSSLDAAVFASVLLKKTGDVLYKTKGYWYNTSDIISELPEVLNVITRNEVTK